MPKEKVDDLEHLAGMSVLEVQELIGAMEEKFEVAAAVAPPHQSATSAENSRKQALQNLASALNARAKRTGT